MRDQHGKALIAKLPTGVGLDLGILVKKGRVKCLVDIWMQHQLFKTGLRKCTYKQVDFNGPEFLRKF